MILTAEHLVKNYGLKPLLSDVSLYVDKGDKIGIIGLNGTGKSTFLRVLAMEEDAIYIADVGQNQIWSCANAVIRKGRFMTSGGMGTMGYSVPAAMGARLGAPDRQVVAVCGDGAFQMTMMTQPV